jgi:hypothetical protein
MKTLSSFISRCGSKKSVIRISKEILVVDFYLNGKCIGEVEYPDKSYPYVRDAAENWSIGVMTVETIQKYSQQAA